MKKIITLLVLAFCLNGNAQVGKEAWHWQFGQNCSLDFSSGIPVVGISKINVGEGCASMSDRNTGQLLFYTDGDSVWDRNNNRMPNGYGLIGGQGTTTQAATIVPKPDSSNIYYLITADYCTFNVPNQGVFYSIIDMNLNGGLGDVTIKNTLLTAPPTTEKVVATRHCNGVDFWVLTHPFNSNNFNTYLINSLGIDTTPIVSNVGTVIQAIGGDEEGAGYLKVSPNGKKIASCLYYYSPYPIVEVYDFDNTTGQVSNSITIPIVSTAPDYYAYGCSFSPDNTKLYVSVSGAGLNEIIQYDISSGIASTIISSSITIASTSPARPGTLQIGPDAKIYVCYDGYNLSDSISVIHAPNNLGAACNFQSKYLILSSGTSAGGGLPNFIDAGLNATFTCSTTGVKQNLNRNQQVNIYPNPNNGSFVIETNAATKQTIQMYDVSGKMVLSQSLTPALSKGEGVVIDASSLNEGVYNISIISNEGVINKRLVIVR